MMIRQQVKLLSIETAIKRGDTFLRRTVTKMELLHLAKLNKGLVVSIEPWVEKAHEQEDLALAMVATNVQSWAIAQGYE